MKLDLKELLVHYRRRVTMVIIATTILFISSQVVVMATVSVRGAEIGDIRREQEQIRLENELLRSQINAAKTLENVTQDVNERFDMRQIPSKVINAGL